MEAGRCRAQVGRVTQALGMAAMARLGELLTNTAYQTGGCRVWLRERCSPSLVNTRLAQQRR